MLISVTVRRLNVKLVTLVADVLGGTSRQEEAHKRSLYSATELAASYVSALKSSLRAEKTRCTGRRLALAGVYSWERRYV